MIASQVVCCCLLLVYPILGAPATKPEETPAVDSADIRQVIKYTDEVIQGCSLYLNTFESLANNSVPFQYCFVQPRPYNSSGDIFHLLAQDLRSAQSLLNYTTVVKNKECKNLTENVYRCIFVSTNILEPLQNLVETLQEIVPANMQDDTANGSGGNEDHSCWSLDDDRQQWNFYELQGLMTIINIDMKKLEDSVDKSTLPPPSKAA